MSRFRKMIQKLFLKGHGESHPDSDTLPLSGAKGKIVNPWGDDKTAVSVEDRMDNQDTSAQVFKDQAPEKEAPLSEMKGKMSEGATFGSDDIDWSKPAGHTSGTEQQEQFFITGRVAPVAGREASAHGKNTPEPLSGPDFSKFAMGADDVKIAQGLEQIAKGFSADARETLAMRPVAPPSQKTP